MNKQIETLSNTRKSVLELVKDLSIESLNEIPAGFNNNIIWNIAHLVAAQQGVCYMRAGLKPVIDEAFVKPYLPNTKPERFIDSAELETIKELLFSTLQQLDTDVNNNIFQNYNQWTTRYGVELSNINDALNFLPFHEGFHTGFIVALKRVLKK